MIGELFAHLGDLVEVVLVSALAGGIGGVVLGLALAPFALLGAWFGWWWK